MFHLSLGGGRRLLVCIGGCAPAAATGGAVPSVGQCGTWAQAAVCALCRTEPSVGECGSRAQPTVWAEHCTVQSCPLSSSSALQRDLSFCDILHLPRLKVLVNSWYLLLVMVLGDLRQIWSLGGGHQMRWDATRDCNILQSIFNWGLLWANRGDYIMKKKSGSPKSFGRTQLKIFWPENQTHRVISKIWIAH